MIDRPHICLCEYWGGHSLLRPYCKAVKSQFEPCPALQLHYCLLCLQC